MNRDVFIFSKGRLRRKNNTLYFIDDQEKQRPMPVESLDSIHLFGEIDFNTSLMHFLTKYGICMHIYNYYGFYDGSYIPRTSRVSGFTKVQQSAHVLDSKKRMFLAQAFVMAAFHHMQRNLRKNGDVQSHLDTFIGHATLLQEAKSIPELMGIEGNCRKIYYDAFRHMLKNDFQWEYRSKRPPHDPINSLISFGNSMMYTSVLSEVYKTHLDPAISFLHEPSSKRYSLCLDIAEIFKPLIVDTLIFNLCNNRRIRNEHFEEKEDAVILNETGRKIFVQAFDGKMKTTFKHRKLKRKVSYRYLIRLEAYKLIKHFIGDETYKPFKAWW